MTIHWFVVMESCVAVLGVALAWCAVLVFRALAEYQRADQAYRRADRACRKAQWEFIAELLGEMERIGE